LEVAASHLFGLNVLTLKAISYHSFIRKLDSLCILLSWYGLWCYGKW